MDLHEAVGIGDPELVRSLLDSGADIRYIRPHGYTVLVDALYNRSIIDDPQLLTLIQLLIEHGADLNAETDIGESALSRTFAVGRFDAVGLLLEAGADPAPLKWTPLHQAVAIGSLDDVRAQLALGDDLCKRDRWDRSPLLLSLQTRDLAKAELLYQAGSDLNFVGRCGITPLMLAVVSGDPKLLQWLLEKGLDPNATDDYGDTALIIAAEKSDAVCVRLLLEAGADPLQVSNTSSPINSAASFAVAWLLVEASADFAQVNADVRDEVTKRLRKESIDCTPEEYQQSKHRIFGNSNPQLMNYPFWRAMVAYGQCAYFARSHFEVDTFRGAAVWCFDRFGKSFTELPDGRVIEIAGEHEDHYDQDFCIYNDVVVHHGDGTFDIYGYPEDVFPPTDFHSATLVGNSIYIIGNLGYYGTRRYGETPMYSLDIRTLAIESVATTGSLPGWIYDHRAVLDGNTIVLTGGKICKFVDGAEILEENSETYTLNLTNWTWSKQYTRQELNL